MVKRYIINIAMIIKPFHLLEITGFDNRHSSVINIAKLPVMSSIDNLLFFKKMNRKIVDDAIGIVNRKQINCKVVTFSPFMNIFLMSA